jgi:hypothetical protein
VRKKLPLRGEENNFNYGVWKRITTTWCGKELQMISAYGGQEQKISVSEKILLFFNFIIRVKFEA